MNNILDNNNFDEFEIYNFWNEFNIFEKSLKDSESDELFIFYDGPPFATGLPHYGHILAGSIKDTIGRYQTQNGKHVPRIKGYDTHGLPIEYEIEKEYNIKSKKDIDRIGIKVYNGYCRDIVMRCAEDWKRIIGRLGRWVDFDNCYKTMDYKYMKSLWWVISELNKKGLLYSSYKVMPYSVACKTPLSNFETQQNYQEVNDITLYIKFKLKDKLFNLIDNVYLVIWTTTPWTLPSNLAVAINKDINYTIILYNNEYLILADNLINKIFNMLKTSKYKKIREIKGVELLDKKYISIFDCYNNQQIKNKAFIIIHGDFVTDNDGTGIVHIAPSYGYDDYEVCIKNNIIDKKDKLFMTIDDEGYFINNLEGLEDLGGKFYKSKKEDGNGEIIKKLKNRDLILYQCNYKHNYPYCWRSDTPLMYRAIESWFINVESIKEQMIELNKNINWVPDYVGHNRFHQWLLQAKDWCIARNRYWGTPIPIYMAEDNDYMVLTVEELEKICNLEPNTINDLHRDNIDHYSYIYNGKEYKRIHSVFDCVSSDTKITSFDQRNYNIENIEELLPLYNNLLYGIPASIITLSYPENNKVINKNFNIPESQLIQRLYNGKIKALMYKGIKECIKLTLEDGRILECTENHKLMSYNINNNNYEWIETNKIIIGETLLVVSIQYPLVDQYYNINYYSYNNNINNNNNNKWKLICKNVTLSYNTLKDRIITNTFARLLGYFIVCNPQLKSKLEINKCYSVKYIYSDKDIFYIPVVNSYDADTIINDIILIYNIIPESYYSFKDERYYIGLNNKIIEDFIYLDNTKFLNKIFRNPFSSINKLRLPNFILDDECPLDIIREFLGGLFGYLGEAPYIYKTNINLKSCFKFSDINYKVNTSIKESKFNLINFSSYEFFDLYKYYYKIIELLKIFDITNVKIKSYYDRFKFNNLPYIVINDSNDKINFYKKISFTYNTNKQYKLDICVSYLSNKCYNDSIYLDVDIPLYIYKNMNINNHKKEYNLLVIDKSKSILKKVYDLSIEGEHSFLANGILSHNCWFESGAMPYASVGYCGEGQFNFPADFIAEGCEQIRGWFYTLLVISTALFNKAPFKNVIGNGLILASDGKKMSKRLQNYPNPMDIIKKYNSDSLRLYLLGSQATIGQSLKFDENGVRIANKDIIIPLLNTIKFLKEYKYKIKLDIPNIKLYTNNNYKTENPLDAYAIKYIGKLIDNIRNDIENYLIADAVRKIYKVVDMLNNQFIKFNRYNLKGKNTNNNWISSLSTLNILVEYISVSLACLMPYFCEYLFKNLSDDIKIISVHLTKFKNYKLPELSIEENKIADEMNNVLDIITLVFKIRTNNNINMKLPIKNLIIKSTLNIINIINKYKNYILDELNILDLNTEIFNMIDIKINITTEFKNVKDKYSKQEDFININKIINNLTSEDKISLANYKNIYKDNYLIEPNFCRIIIEPLNINGYYSQYDYINETNYCVYISSEITEDIKKMGYAKLIATRFQRLRKHAGLHPWETNIKLLYQGKPEYDLNEDICKKIIYDTCNLYIYEYDIDIYNTSNIIYKDKFTSIIPEYNLTLYII